MSHRDRLLEGALQCLREKGYARTTARDIVAASGTNLASIGYHFGSKEALLNEAIGEAFREWSEQLATLALAGEQTEPLERMLESWAQMVDGFEEHRPLLVAFVESLAPALRSPELRDQLAQQYEDGRQAIGALVAATLGDRPGADAVDGRLVASFVMAVCDGLLLQYLLDVERAPTGEQLRAGLAAAAATLAESAPQRA